MSKMLIRTSRDNPGKFYIWYYSRINAYPDFLSKTGNLGDNATTRVLGPLSKGLGSEDFYYNSRREAIQYIKKFFYARPINKSSTDYEVKAKNPKR